MEKDNLGSTSGKPSALVDTRVIYCGDNLRILRDYVADASVDLIYLDPPFSSSATNILVAPPFRAARAGLKPGATRGSEESAAQITAFEETRESNAKS